MLNMNEMPLEKGKEIGYCRWMYEQFYKLKIQAAIEYARLRRRQEEWCGEQWREEAFEADQARQFMLNDAMNEYCNKLHGWSWNGVEESSYVQVYLPQKWRARASKEE